MLRPLGYIYLGLRNNWLGTKLLDVGCALILSTISSFSIVTVKKGLKIKDWDFIIYIFDEVKYKK